MYRNVEMKRFSLLLSLRASTSLVQVQCPAVVRVYTVPHIEKEAKKT